MLVVGFHASGSGGGSKGRCIMEPKGPGPPDVGKHACESPLETL